jgi:hypothetical protein
LEKNLVGVDPWLWKEVKNEEEKVKSELCGRHSGCHWVEVRKITKRGSEVWKSKPLDEEIEDDRSARKMDRG